MVEAYICLALTLNISSVDNLRHWYLYKNTHTDVEVYNTRLIIQESIKNHPAESISYTHWMQP